MSIQWSLVIFTALTGCAGWVLVCLGISEFLGERTDRHLRAAYTALALTVIGGLASVTHLSHPEHILYALGHPTSGIFTEALLCGLIAVAVCVYIVACKKSSSVALRKISAGACGVLGLIISFAAGSSYMMVSINAWNTLVLPLGYLLTAILVGYGVFELSVFAGNSEARAAHAFIRLLTRYAKEVSLVLGIVICCGVICYGIAFASHYIALYIVVAVLELVAVGMLYRSLSAGDAGIVNPAILVACAACACLLFRVGMWLVYDKAIDLFGLII